MIFNERRWMVSFPICLSFFSEGDDGNADPKKDPPVDPGDDTKAQAGVEPKAGEDTPIANAPEPISEDALYSQFDTKSDLMGGGRLADKEPADTMSYFTDMDSPYDKVAQGDPLEEPQEGEPAAVQSKDDAKPFRVINYAGRDIPVQTQEQYDGLASAGLEASYLKQQIAPYAPYVLAVERDPELREQVMALIHAKQSGVVPPQTPAPAVENYDEEPEQKDDETFDEYDKRLAVWKKERDARAIEQGVNKVLHERASQLAQARAREVQDKLVEHVKADPHARDVLQVIYSDDFPHGLKLAIDQDPEAFKVVYDQICRSQGRDGYFGAPLSMGGEPSQRGGDNVNANPEGRTVLKKQVPFAERGGVGSPRRSGSNLPDFKKMSEAEFDKVLSRVHGSGL